MPSSGIKRSDVRVETGSYMYLYVCEWPYLNMRLSCGCLVKNRVCHARWCKMNLKQFKCKYNQQVL